MTTVAAATSGGAKPAAAAATPLRAHPTTLALGFILAVAFCGLFYRWIWTQHQHSSHKMEDWGHFYCMPLISAALIWQRRAELVAAEKSAFWPALAPLVLGIACYAFFLVGYPNHMFAGASVILTLASTVLLLLGPRVFRLTLLPIAYLMFGVTFSEMVMIKMTFPLQLIASQGAGLLLRLLGPVLGYYVEVEGNTLTMYPGKGSPIPLNVAEQCSGMRMVIAFFALGGAVALFSCRHWWQRIALLLAAAPVAVLMNVLRVAVLGLASLVNPALASGQAHKFIGTLLLIPGLSLFMVVVWALNKAVIEPAGPGPRGAAA